MEIKNLTLKTHRLDDLRAFYGDRLGFSLLEETDDRLTLDAGATRLIFERDESQVYQYHFAFNIPANQLLDAQAWLAQYVDILPGGDGSMIVTHAPGWQSKALYFTDPAGNIVEFVARERIDCGTPVPFSAQSIQSVSEIGLAVNDVPSTAEAVKDLFPYFEPGSESFQPMGDDYGLLILVKTGHTWYPTQDVPARVLPVDLTVAGDEDKLRDLTGYPYHIRVT